ncbi:MAG: efflux RND transporter periplasmic adaptor subunit [Bacteroidota bacterium]|nr:efflux RND transporter periplasmic adaptor subunit [Bacteroidota bacterium]MDP4206473.1 efflux RND transporter periplasmic adaptor subunit [Bacteroidota bacterium]
MKKVITLIVIIVLVVLAGMRLKSNHDKINSKKQTNSGISSVVTVNVTSVKRMESPHTLNLVGTLNPNTEINIAAEAQGQITSLNVELGQAKGKGCVLGTIDNKLKRLAVQSAKISEARLKRDLQRYENLYKGGSATEQQLDDARISYENAKIQLEQAKKQLADATITAPISGVIALKQVERGAFVNIGTPIATIVDISKLKIKLNVSEGNVYKLKVGDKAQITTDVYPGATFYGRITFISAKGDETHNYQVEIVIPNNAKHALKAGTFVNASVDIPSNGSALFIPREALQGSIQDAKVYVVENGIAKLKQIVVTSGDDKNLQVVSGLNEGEQVVVTGQINLTDGKAIKIVSSN